MYTLLGRLILSFFFLPDSENYIWKAFCRLTGWVLHLVAFITPRSVPPPVLIFFAFLWVLFIRQAFRLFMVLNGLAPVVQV